MTRLKDFGLGILGVDPQERSVFAFQTRCVCASYERNFEVCETDRTWKVQVDCISVIERPDVLQALGVAVVQVQFDYRQYLLAEGPERMRAALDALQQGVLRFAGHEGLPIAPFWAAYKRVVAGGYKNETTSKSVRDPGTKRTATLHSVHDWEGFRAWIVVFDPGGSEMKRKLVVDEPPDEFVFAKWRGSVRWSGPSLVTFCLADGQVADVLELDDLPESDPH